MRWSPEQRRRILRDLDSAERVAASLLQFLLLVVLVAVITIVIVVIRRAEPGGNTQGEHFYFAVAVLLVVGWLVTQIVGLRRRAARSQGWEAQSGASFQAPAVDDSGIVPLDDGTGYTRSFRIQFGDAAPDDPPTARPGLTFGRTFNMGSIALPIDVMPDDATLDHIAAGLDRGDDFDALCSEVQPAWPEWNVLARRAYRMLLEARLEERRRASG